MRSALALLMVLAFAASSSFADESECPASVCGPSKNVSDRKAVIIYNRKNEYGQWETTISTFEDAEGAADGSFLKVEREVFISDGREILQVKAVIKGSDSALTNVSALKFHDKGGNKASVDLYGHTAERLSPESDTGNGGIVTNRQLRNDEMFEVKLDKLIQKYDTSLGLGITYHTLEHIDYQGWMSCGTIMLYNDQIYENGSVTKKGYGPNLRTLKVGDRVGLMKKRNGDLHFFVNGFDLGVAKSGIHYPVIGVLDLYGNAVEATLITH